MDTDMSDFCLIICSVDDCGNVVLARNMCAKHYYRLTRYGDVHKLKYDEYDLEDGCRKCTECEEAKELAEFRLESKGSLGRSRKCKKCDQKYTKDWKSANKQVVRLSEKRSRVARKYGVAGLAVIDRLESGEGCDICGGRAGKIGVDHCHKTGKVRGLLCGNCNTALGLLKEDASIVISLLSYLDTHNKTFEKVVFEEEA